MDLDWETNEVQASLVIDNLDLLGDDEGSLPYLSPRTGSVMSASMDSSVTDGTSPLPVPGPGPADVQAPGVPPEPNESGPDREDREQKTTKNDQAPVPTYLWREHLIADGPFGWLRDTPTAVVDEAMDALRRLAFRW